MSRLNQLEEILKIAEYERDLVHGGGVESLTRLQQDRQGIIDSIQNLDALTAEEQKVIERILSLDREMRILLLSQLADIKEKITTISHARRVLKSYRTGHPRTSRRLSHHI